MLAREGTMKRRVVRSREMRRRILLVMLFCKILKIFSVRLLFVWEKSS